MIQPYIQRKDLVLCNFKASKIFADSRWEFIWKSRPQISHLVSSELKQLTSIPP